jgi:hypothetical protein
MKRARSLQDRISKYVEKTNSCWLWTRGKNAKGYGICSEGLVHRAVYKMTFGSIPDGAYVLHKCDVRNCCNPDHLYAGSQKDNMRDMIERGRTGNRRGQPKGEAHSMAKIKQSDAEAIIEAAYSGVSATVLSEKYGVGRNQIARIVSGERWPHLPRPYHLNDTK